MSEPIGVVVTGVSGRMGSRILAMVVDDPGTRLVGATEAPGNAKVGLDAGFAAGRGSLEVPIRDDLAEVLSEGAAKVVIDFTSAQASANHARICAEHGVALVVGSTGFDDAAEEEVRRAAERVAIVKAPNMSVSVNLLFLLARRAAEILGDDYQVEITEVHHAMKKDSPSGTALRLGEMVAEGLGRDFRDVAVFGRHGNVGERPPREIGVHAIRGADVVGEHTVFFFGEGDRIELTHRATSRDTFARGAVRAAKWVAGRSPGLYGMADVLEFE